MNGNKVILAAHRGDRKNAPENTMPAFEKSLAFGADMIETDVRMTKDGELILMHDRSTLRTTGYEGFTNEMTLEEIKALDAGGWFSEDYKGTQVPTVKEFIALIQDSDMLVNWELKDYPAELGDEFAFRTDQQMTQLGYRWDTASVPTCIGPTENLPGHAPELPTVQQPELEPDPAA